MLLPCPCGSRVCTAERYLIVYLFQDVLAKSTTTSASCPVFCQDKLLWTASLHASRCAHVRDSLGSERGSAETKSMYILSVTRK